MGKIHEADERLFAELREALNAFLGLLTPVTERFAPLDVIVRRLLSEKVHSTAAMKVSIAVLGNKGTGKSAFVNAIMGKACLPEDTIDPIAIRPSSDAQPMLRTAKGKSVALGTENVRRHLIDERTIRVPELLTRSLHTRLLDSGECYSATWHIVDNPANVAAICPKLSSVASRTYSPNEFVADVVFYCVDARELGTPRERFVFDNLFTLSEDERGAPHPRSSAPTPVSSRRRLKQCLFLVLTHIDAISDFEECMSNIHNKEPPALHTTQQVFDRFYDLCEDVFDEKFPEERVVVMNCRGATMAKNVLRKFSSASIDVDAGSAQMPKDPPNVHELYDYSEAFFGSAFMQTVDTMPLNDLQRLVVHHAWFQGIVKTGAMSIDSVLAILDFNGARHLMSSVAVAASEVADTLRVALDHGAVTLQRELETSLEHVGLLEAEIDWVHKSIDRVQSAAQELMSEVAKISDAVVTRFCKRRLEELGYVIGHEGLEWFMSRQIGVVVDMKSALNKFEAFTVRYLQQRQYLYDKMGHDAAAAAGGGSDDGASSHYGDDLDDSGGANATRNSASDFILTHMDAVLQNMEEEKRDQLLPLYIRFGHLLRDEFEHVFEDLVAEVEATRRTNIDKFFETCRVPVEQTRLRTKEAIDLEAAKEQLASIQLIERNPRRLNNFVRELPEHVASAAIGIAADEYQRQRETGSDLFQIQHDAASDAIGQPGARSNATSPVRGLRIRTYRFPAAGTSEMASHLGYVCEAWRLALMTVGIDMLATFRYEELAETTGRVCADLVEYLSGYAASLREGLEDQRQQVDRIRTEIHEATTKVATVKQSVVEFDRIRMALENVNATNTVDVSHVRIVERQSAQTRRRSMDDAQIPRRRASMYVPMSVE